MGGALSGASDYTELYELGRRLSNHQRAEWSGRRSGRVTERAVGPTGPDVSNLERETGFEPATSTLARSHSTTELFPLTPTARARHGPRPAAVRKLQSYHSARAAIKDGGRRNCLSSYPLRHPLRSVSEAGPYPEANAERYTVSTASSPTPSIATTSKRHGLAVRWLRAR